jgi:hypothetical protein
LSTGVIVLVPGLFWRTLSRVPHIQFTRELLLHVTNVHIYLVVDEENLF